MKNHLQKDRLLLIVYLISIITITSVHNIYFLMAVIPLLILLSNKHFFQTLKKTIVSIMLFNFIVSISYIIMSVINNNEWSGYIILINLRVFDATFLTFLFIDRVNLFSAISFSEDFSFLLILSYSQIMIYKRNYENFKLSFRSRNLVFPKKTQLYNFIRSTFVFFLNSSMHNSHEISLAMKSRCFNND